MSIEMEAIEFKIYAAYVWGGDSVLIIFSGILMPDFVLIPDITGLFSFAYAVYKHKSY